MSQWRVITDNPMSGAWNMAIDEAILDAVSAGDQLPTLRLYGWEPLCLSLGYGQRASDADIERIHEHGWELVRRPTGGRAILHGDELTYSVALPIGHDLAQGDVIASYRRLSQALVHALQTIGLEPRSEKQDKDALRNRGAVCFEIPSHYEITVNNRKLIGSAQLRRKFGILQHGTVPLVGDISRICDALAYESDEARDLAREKVVDRATTMERVLGEPIDWHTTAEALVIGFEKAFDIEFEHMTLSQAEIDRATELHDTIYNHDSWNFKR